MVVARMVMLALSHARLEYCASHSVPVCVGARDADTLVANQAIPTVGTPVAGLPRCTNPQAKGASRPVVRPPSLTQARTPILESDTASPSIGPVDRVINFLDVGEAQSCCEPNEQSDTNAQCCGFTDEGQAIDANCNECVTPLTGQATARVQLTRRLPQLRCCTAAAPNAGRDECCSNETYYKEQDLCCPGGIARGPAEPYGCCMEGEEPHVASTGQPLCCSIGTYDEVTQTW